MTRGTLCNMHIVHQSMLHSNALFIVFLASRGGGGGSIKKNWNEWIGCMQQYMDVSTVVCSNC